MLNKYGGYFDVQRADERVYDLWYGMLRRCYDKEQHERDKGKAYADCKVCDEWLVFSNFANDIVDIPGYYQWRVNEDMHLDKDILSNGDKEYNKRNCCFVPSSVNVAYMNRTHPNITHNANEANKVVYVLHKDNETLVFESERDACEYLGVAKCSVASCYRRGYKCKGYRIAKMDEVEDV